MGWSLDEITQFAPHLATLHPDHPANRKGGGRGRKPPPTLVEPPPAAGSVHCVWMPGFTPTRLNQLLGCHHAKAGRLKAADRDAVIEACRRHGTPWAEGKRRLTLCLVMAKGQRKGDPDAYYKALADALVHAKVLKDDSDNWVEHAPVRYWRGAEGGTLVVLEDI